MKQGQVCKLSGFRGCIFFFLGGGFQIYIYIYDVFMLIFIDFLIFKKKSGSPNVFQGLGLGHNRGQIEVLVVGIPRGRSKCRLKGRPWNL